MAESLRTVVHTVVAARSPGDLSDVDVIIDAAAASPGAARRAGSSWPAPNQSGSGVTAEVLANVVSNLIASGILVVAGGLLARVRLLLRRRADPDAALPVLSPATRPVLREHLVRSALARGLPESEAQSLAEDIIEAWPAES